jgi:tape measure domain-containing protein
MSTTIDQRVVEMRFDNRQFESNVATTMSTLDRLKHSLSLDDTARTMGLKFDAMYSMTDQFVRRITDRVMNFGERIVKSLTIDPITTGFKEYETQIGAIQTIWSNTKSKGTTLDDVNSALDELNTYADKTIYNFTEMTRNIGTFTAAGVELDTSVSAIKGIANLAAVSGSTSQQASTAMYQLSQAMASGTVKLMDWNSVVNAGMGGQIFQDALKETAKVHGVAIDDIIKKQGSFRESLSEGWLTTDILTETLSKFTGDLTEEQLKTLEERPAQLNPWDPMGSLAYTD